MCHCEGPIISGQKRLVSETDFGQESADADEPEDNPEENEILQNIMENTTAMTHPVIFQNINLCEKRSKLGRYGEKKLKSMMEILELSPIDTDKWSCRLFEGILAAMSLLVKEMRMITT